MQFLMLTFYRFSVSFSLFMTILFYSPTLLFSQKLNLELKWAGNQGCFLESSASVADIDNDGSDEAIIAAQEELISVGKDGSSLWRWRTRGRFMTYPAVLKRVGQPSLIYASDNSGQLSCLNGKGKVIWQAELNAGSEWSASVVADPDGNGSFELVQTDLAGTVWVFDALNGYLLNKTYIHGVPVSPAVGDLNNDEKGKVLWTIDMQGRSLAPGAIADINNDGKPEYIISAQQGHFLVINNTGDVIYDHQLKSRTINVTPSIGRITANSEKLELYLTGGESGMTYCFETPAIKNPVIQWSNYRGDIQNSGSWFGLTKSDKLSMVPQNLEWNKILTGERIQFNINNPKPGSEPLKASAICISPEGVKNRAITNIQGEQGQLFLPVNFTVSGNYKFTWTLTTSSGKELISSLQKMVPVLSAKSVQNLINNTSLLNGRSKRAVLITEIAAKAAFLGSGTSIIAFEGNKWDNRNIDKQLPAKIENPVLLNHSVVPGEHQPLPIALFNVTDHLLNVRLVVNNQNRMIKVTAFRSINTPTSLGEESWDALPEIDDSGVISIPSLTCMEVWLDIEIGTVIPDKHVVNITFQALNGAGDSDTSFNPHAVPAPETKVNITLDVLPFKMAPSSDFRLCTWSPSSGQEVAGLLAHGNNVFLLSGPILKYNAQDQLTGFDYAECDKILSRLKGNDVFFLVNGLPGIKEEFATEGYNKQFALYLNDLVSHLARNGISTSHFALYPIDEPGGAGWKAVNKVVFDFVCNDSKMEDFRNEMILCIRSIIDSNNANQQNKTWSEKLGFPKGKKVLLLHIDDAGMCPEANAATENYIENGHLQSAAVMMPCPNAESIINWANSHPSADIGVHLTLTSEWKNYRWGPVSDPSGIPGLVDPSGKFYHEVAEVVTHASAKEVETEIRAQIEKAIELGHRPTHIDTHMGTLYGSEEYIKVFLNIAKEFRIPANIIDLSDPKVVTKFKQAGYPIDDAVINLIGEYDLPKLDNFTSVQEGSSYEEKRDNFFKMVNSLNSGLTEIIFHPAVKTENLKTITGSWQQRVWEGELFADPVVKQFFKDEGIIITNWKEIMERFEGREL